MVFSWLFRGPHLLRKTVFGRFSWLFRGPHFGQILRVLALEESSDNRGPKTKEGACISPVGMREAIQLKESSKNSVRRMFLHDRLGVHSVRSPQRYAEISRTLHFDPN